MNTITNANVYLEEGPLFGKLEEVTLPSLKMKMQEMNALGMYGSVEVPVGMEVLELKLKWNCIYPENLSAFNPLKSTRLIVKANMQTHSPLGVLLNTAVTVFLSGSFKELPLGTIKPGQKQDGLETVMTVYYYKLQVNGIPIQEVDVYNNIFVVGVEDVLLPFKLNQ